MKHLLNYRLFFTVATSLFSFSVIAQPVNDECAGAIQLAHDAWPMYLTTSAAGATPSMGGSTKDVWYTFMATSDILFVRLTNSPMKYEIYGGGCGNLSLINAEEPLGGFCADMPDSTVLTVGQTYYVRVYFTSTINDWQPFQICLLTRPVYDVCNTAPELTMNYNNIIDNDSLSFGSMMYGRVSTQMPISYPFMTTGGTEDIWFKFTATDTAHTVFLGSISYITCWTGSSYAYLYAKYKGCTTADTIGTPMSIPLLFDTAGYVDFTSLTIGSTYYVRLWTNKMTGVSADFFAGVGPLGSIGQMPPPLTTSDLVPKNNTLVISPNPTNSKIKIEMSGENYGSGKVSILDITGKEKYKGLYKSGQEIDVVELASGIYFIRYTDEQGPLSTKFVKH